jgi:pimeloyl-ACP methyl ester carboxylesterase
MMKTQFIEPGEGKIAYEEAAPEPISRGPLVVCVPGMGDLRGEYRYLAPQIAAAGYRAVCMDLRGHGESSVGWKDYSAGGIRDDILALIRQLDAGPAIVVGNSFAASAAVWAAAAAPELVQGLVLVGPAVHGKISGTFRLLLKALFARPWGPVAWQQYYKGLFTTRKPADLAEFSMAIRQNMREKGRIEALYQMMVSPTPDADTRLEQVRAPALVLMGSKDPDFKDPTGEARWIAEQIKGECTIIEGAGHYPQTEMPEISGAHIIEFLNKVHMEASLETASHS